MKFVQKRPCGEPEAAALKLLEIRWQGNRRRPIQLCGWDQRRLAADWRQHQLVAKADAAETSDGRRGN
jgi:hypothetical protein